MKFTSRTDAGEKLGNELLAKGILSDVVLGLPRGGVIVAAEIARILKQPLDVLVVRKIGHPRSREFAVGALAEAATVVLDKEVLARTCVEPEELDKIIAEEISRLNEYVRKFERNGRTTLAGKTVILADDGLATGATTEAAVRSAKKQGAEKVIVAVPVSSTNGYARLTKVSDLVISLVIDPEFQAVGQFYWNFPQTTDEEVIRSLENAANGTG